MRTEPVPEEAGIPLFIFTRNTDNPYQRRIKLRLALRPMRHHPSYPMPQFQKPLRNINITDCNGSIALQRIKCDQ